MTATAATKSKPKRAADRTRAAILKAAGERFAQGGLAGARTDAIARAAGVNKAMLYYYFDSKERLYEAVVEDIFRAFNEQAIALLQSPGSPGGILLRYVELHFDFIARHARFAALFQQFMQAGGRAFSRLVQRHFAPRASALGSLLRRGMREGVFRRTDPMQAAISVTALIVFYFSAAPVLRAIADFDAQTPAHLAQRKREVLEFVRRGLFVDPEKP